MTTTTIAAWLLTYLLHSTVILGAVLVISRILDGRNLAVQETLLRTALLGGVVTASLQLGFGVAPIAGEFSLEPAVQPAIAAAVDPGHTVSARPDAGALSSGRPGGAAWAAPFVVFWCVASTIALVAVLRSILDLRRLLRSRCFQSAGRLVETLAAAMGLRRKVRISTSKAIAVPFATGIRRPEICCPERVNDLAIEHKRSLFAHELAHLARRDPAWQLVYRIGESLLVLQPLNRLVRRRLEELAEHLTDDRAAASTGDRLGLARCMVVVAHWGRSEGIGLPATAFAAGPRLDRRVRRLISASADRQISSRWAVAVAAALMTGAALILPVVAVPPLHAESTATTTLEAKTWSTADDRPEETPPASEPAPKAPPAAEPPAAAPAEMEAPPAPESPHPAPGQPEAAPASEALPAPEKPPAAPRPESPPAKAVPHAATAPPAPGAKASPQSAPAPVAPSTRERERATERRREVARERSSERARAEAIARQHREVVRVDAERAREMAREAAQRARLTQDELTEMRLQVEQLQGEARRLAREAAGAERESSEAMRAEARALARQSALRVRQLTAEQREAMLEKALEMRKRAEAENLEVRTAAEERARELAVEARALAEQAEAERRQMENEKK